MASSGATFYAEVPPRVEYSLTEFGSSLQLMLKLMGAWGEEYRQAVEGFERNQNGNEK